MNISLRSRVFLLLFIFAVTLSYSQKISGKIIDKSTSENINQGFLLVFDGSAPDITLGYSIIQNGAYDILLKSNDSKKLILVPKVPGYSVEEKTIDLKSLDQIITVDFALQPAPEQLTSIEIVAERPKKVIQKIDTTSFHLKSFTEDGDTKLKDVIGKIPLVDYDPASGKIKYKGKEIENITINGTDITGSGYGLIVKNLNIDIIERLEAIDNYSDNAVTKNFDLSNRKSINLVLKKNRYQLAVDLESLLGTFDLDKVATGNAINSNIFNNKINSINVVSQNNIGLNPSTLNIEEFNSTFRDPVLGENLENLFNSEIVNTNAVPFERSRINRQGYGSINGTVKLNPKTELRLNADYLEDLHDVRKISQSTFDIADTTLTNKLVSNSIYDPSYRGLSLFLSKKNGSKSDLKGTLSITNNTTIRNSDIIRNERDSVVINEEQDYSNLEFSSEYSRRVYENSALQFKILFTKESSNLDFNSNPGILSGSDNLGDDNQFYYLNRIKFSPSVSFFSKLGKGNVVINLSSINSSIDFNSSLASTSGAVSSVNNIDLNNSNYYLSSLYSYKADKFTFSLSPVIGWLNQELNLLESSNIKFLPRVSLNYKFKHGLIIVSGSKSARQLRFENSFQNIILTSENNVENNLPDLRPINSYNLNVNSFFTGNDLTTQSFQAYNNTSWSDASYISNLQVDENFLTATNEYLLTRVFNTNSGLNYSQYLQEASLRVEINPSISYSENPISVNGNEITSFNSSVISARFGLKTIWQGFFNLDVSTEFSQAQSSFNDIQLNNNRLNSSLKFKFKFSKEMRLALNYTSLVPDLSQINYTDFIDLDFSFNFFKSVRSQFIARNVTNRRSVINQSIDGISRSFSSNNLLPRYMGIKVEFDLK